MGKILRASFSKKYFQTLENLGQAILLRGFMHDVNNERHCHPQRSVLYCRYKSTWPPECSESYSAICNNTTRTRNFVLCRRRLIVAALIVLLKRFVYGLNCITFFLIFRFQNGKKVVYLPLLFVDELSNRVKDLVVKKKKKKNPLVSTPCCASSIALVYS